ncbi:hypothetical protein BaRGS_00036426 [Batillaria attramentaria]|uniref:Uncharacterized protein n=1 Tax=Batillaria attramentaria TaxID=370345 RepID=A0ABD0JC05_9CAEN
MLLERSGSAAHVPVMAAKLVSEQEAEIDLEADDTGLDPESQRQSQTFTPRKTGEAFEVDFGEPMPEKAHTNLQEAFKKFRKQRQVGYKYGLQ